MRTDAISFVLVSDNRKRVVKSLLDYPKRQWSCTSMEEATKLPHATVFRTLKALAHFGMLKSIKINKKDIIYDLVDSRLTDELKRALNIDRIIAKNIALDFVDKIRCQSKAVVLYGSSVKGNMKPDSDIDILVVASKAYKKNILDAAADTSSKSNRAISAVVMDKRELHQEKKSQFINSIKDNMEVLYGKSPF